MNKETLKKAVDITNEIEKLKKHANIISSAAGGEEGQHLRKLAIALPASYVYKTFMPEFLPVTLLEFTKAYMGNLDARIRMLEEELSSL